VAPPGRGSISTRRDRGESGASRPKIASRNATHGRVIGLSHDVASCSAPLRVAKGMANHALAAAEVVHELAAAEEGIPAVRAAEEHAAVVVVLVA